MYTHSATTNHVDMSNLIRQGYCLECSWRASTADHTREELTDLLVEHAVETGHDVDSGLLHPGMDPPKRPELN